MGQGLHRFISRSYRYTLRPQDRKDMRFSLSGNRGQGGIEDTLLLNLSETGAGFLVARGTSLHLDEKIKVEIPIPGGDTIAWWGRVVRLEEYHSPGWSFGRDPFADSPRTLVGLKFDPLPDGHSRSIRKGIESSFMQAMRDQQYRNWAYYRAKFRAGILQAFLIGALACFAVWLLWYLSQPSANYDAVKGAPWGERFKFF